MLDNLKACTSGNLLEEVRGLKEKQYRFISITCEKDNGGYELTYHLDHDYELTNLRIGLEAGEGAKSISSIYPAAFLIENEIQDLFGIEFDGLTIDYRGKLFLTGEGPGAPLK